MGGVDSRLELGMTLLVGRVVVDVKRLMDEVFVRGSEDRFGIKGSDKEGPSTWSVLKAMHTVEGGSIPH